MNARSNLILGIALTFTFSGCGTRVKEDVQPRVRKESSDFRRDYVFSDTVVAAVRKYALESHGWSPDVYSLSYLGHRNGLVGVNLHHRDEEKSGPHFGSVLDFFVEIDEATLEVKREGRLQ